VSEYGVAHLRYKSRRERAEALINISHPDLRGELRAALKKNFYYSA
jgi:4-hydroxybutyrate CoA-transferase